MYLYSDVHRFNHLHKFICLVRIFALPLIFLSFRLHRLSFVFSYVSYVECLVYISFSDFFLLFNFWYAIGFSFQRAQALTHTRSNYPNRIIQYIYVTIIASNQQTKLCIFYWHTLIQLN